MVIEKSPKRNGLSELREHATEMREFEDADWEGTREDSELLWNIRDVLPRSVEKGELELPVKSEPVTESELDQSSELPIRDAELLLAELDANPLETDVDQKGGKVENAERPL